MHNPDDFDSAGFADYIRDAAIFLLMFIAGLAIVYFFA